MNVFEAQEVSPAAILNLHGRIALVTGAGQGIGRDITRKLAGCGAKGIVVNDYVAERAQAVAAELVAMGSEAIGVQGDVTSLESVKALTARAIERFGHIDILVNNAGNGGASPPGEISKPFWQSSPEVWNAHLGVNLYGVLNCVSAVVPGMVERKRGRIITIISEAGRVGEPGLEVYSAAKAGASGFTRAIARSLGRYNILANTVSVAATVTPATEEALNALPPEQQKRWLDKYVVRRFGLPADVANMVTFLASDSSSWITGQNYPVNGGFSFAL